ncbi:GAF domain-containing sensor histidine kinase [Thiolinea disciformis]|uniref:GAF domain-containing sensor histidine kinase n=1 Tax=Thiolinea disciformis TaxID=125614 RepID=UPI00035CD24E|nr:histidine kinase [Thiolinea disciformis]
MVTATSSTTPDMSATTENGRTIGSRAQAKYRSGLSFPLRVRVILVFLVLAFGASGLLSFWALLNHAQANWILPSLLVVWVLTAIGTLSFLYWMWREFNFFGQELSDWVTRLRAGDLNTRMPMNRKGCPSLRIREQINAITDDYQAMSRMQQQRLNRQAQFIAQKNRHLTVLYDVASCINRANSLEALFERVLRGLREVFKAKAVAIRLSDEQGELKLVASFGLSDEIVALEQRLPSPECICGKTLKAGLIEAQPQIQTCDRLLKTSMFGTDSALQMLAVPLQYREKILGVYNLFVSPEQFAHLQEEEDLLTSIGQHLGMAIEKARVEKDVVRLSIIEERTRMAHELHDSLAQTLASLRFKVRLLDDTLHRGDETIAWQELENLEQTVDEAYAELRSLITHFRAPLDGKGVVRAVEKITERFRVETQMEVFFYHNWNLAGLPSEMELEVVRIVQEALANVRKHSKASTVRILMYSSEEGRCSILVEDDGVGLPQDLPKFDPKTGEHIGMKIMQERAEKIGGEVQFESDPEEGGTLMQLSFQAPVKVKADVEFRPRPTVPNTMVEPASHA